MPFKMGLACRAPGCGNVVRGGGYCEDHQYMAKAKQREKKVNPFYSSAAWKGARARYRARHPLCERCEAKGIVKPTDMVHHITPIEGGGQKLAESNFESLCWACHGEEDHAK